MSPVFFSFLYLTVSEHQYITPQVSNKSSPDLKTYYSLQYRVSWAITFLKLVHGETWNSLYIQGSSSLSVYSGVNIPQKIFLTVFISNYYLIILRRSWKRDEEDFSGIVSGIIEDDFQNLSIQVCFCLQFSIWNCILNLPSRNLIRNNSRRASATMTLLENKLIHARLSFIFFAVMYLST